MNAKKWLKFIGFCVITFTVLYLLEILILYTMNAYIPVLDAIVYLLGLFDIVILPTISLIASGVFILRGDRDKYTYILLILSVLMMLVAGYYLYVLSSGFQYS